MTDQTAREEWSSNTGFVLAALGSAVGLGNVWRFAYVAGENGGGAFLLLYLGAVLLIGLPLLIAEFAVGRHTQRDPVGAFLLLGGTRRRRYAGWPSVIAATAILAYYTVIAGWALKYFALYATGQISGLDGGTDAYFQAFLARDAEVLFWHGTIMAATAAVVALGVARGIERLSKFLMPVFAMLLIGLAGHSLTLDGAARGVAFVFAPDWHAFGEPRVYLAAIGQAFFSLGLGMGVLMTYGSYLPRGRRLILPAAAVAIGDTAFALIAGLMIFPAVFTFGLDPAAGPTLAFITMPDVFAAMPGGSVFGAAFFGLLVIAALTSSVSLLEVPVASVMHHLGWRRGRAAAALGGAIFLLGVPAALSFGLLSEARPFGTAILDLMDQVSSNLLLPLNGLIVAVFVGWAWTAREARHASGLRGATASRLWLWSLRYLVPAVILAIAIQAFTHF